jgi:hypothetical protein
LWQLFDVKDEQAVTNLADRPSYAQRRAEMRQRLEEWHSRAR